MSYRRRGSPDRALTPARTSREANRPFYHELCIGDRAWVWVSLSPHLVFVEETVESCARGKERDGESGVVGGVPLPPSIVYVVGFGTQCCIHFVTLCWKILRIFL